MIIRSDATAADDKYLQLNHWIFIMQRNREIVYYSYYTALKLPEMIEVGHCFYVDGQ